MARRRLEVQYLRFEFACCKDTSKAITVTDELTKYLKKYASGTAYSIACDFFRSEDTDTIVQIQFSKKLSVNTVMNFLSYMFVGEREFEAATYNPKTEMIAVYVAGGFK